MRPAQRAAARSWGSLHATHCQSVSLCLHRWTRCQSSASEVQHKLNNSSVVISHFDKATERAVFLGPLKLDVPLGVGCAAWGDTSVWGFNSSDKSFTEQSIEEAYVHLREKGISFFDTAELYGRGVSEEILGRLMVRHADRFKDKPPVVVASKFLPLPMRASRDSLKKALRATLDRLKADCVDLYQVHSPMLSVRTVETWAEAMAEVFQAGLIKAVGVSNYSRKQVSRTHKVLAKYGIPLASNQIEFSLARADPAVNGTIEACKQLNVAVIAYSPLAMGALTGKYSAANPPSSPIRSLQYPMKKIDPIVHKLAEIGRGIGKTPSQVALNWCISKGTIPIAGVKNARQAEDNLGAVGWRLSPEAMKDLDTLARCKGWRLWQADSR